MHKSYEQYNSEAAEILDSLDINTITAKQRRNIPVQEMPVQDPAARIHNMDEVATGYGENQAVVESLRCLQCPTAPCIEGCPVNINIPAFLKSTVEKDFAAAHRHISESSLLPSICGRVCPQEKQCQLYCTVGKAAKDTAQSVSIGRVERFIGDWAAEHLDISIEPVQPSGKKAAVIGAGPAGIAAAADLAKAGHKVTVFEAFHKAGGVMMYGIPEFRLPKKIVKKEIDMLERYGVEFRFNFLVGRTAKLEDLLGREGFDAIFIGSGAGLPRFLGIEGENLVGVFSANEYLTRANLMKAYDKNQAATPFYPSSKTVIVGGGNVAMDAARMAKRLGSKEVKVIYRRTREEMPARIEEVCHAEEEGIEFVYLSNPVRFEGDASSKICKIEIEHFVLGDADESGRRKPVPSNQPHSSFEADCVIVAIGNDSNPLLTSTVKELESDKRGRIITDGQGQTSMKGVWAGGDIVLGAATVILAMGEGQKAAASMNKYLSEK